MASRRGDRGTFGGLRWPSLHGQIFGQPPWGTATDPKSQDMSWFKLSTHGGYWGHGGYFMIFMVPIVDDLEKSPSSVSENQKHRLPCLNIIVIDSLSSCVSSKRPMKTPKLPRAPRVCRAGCPKRLSFSVLVLDAPFRGETWMFHQNCWEEYICQRTIWYNKGVWYIKKALCVCFLVCVSVY